MSLPVCDASASRKSLCSWRARRRSYQTTATFTNMVAAMSDRSASDGKSGCSLTMRCRTPSRSSSKHEMERKPTMASAPSVSNF